jgi:hypothetical protein
MFNKLSPIGCTACQTETAEFALCVDKGKTETGIAVVELERNKIAMNKFVLSNLINICK